MDGLVDGELFLQAELELVFGVQAFDIFDHHLYEKGGRVLYSGPPDGLKEVEESRTRPFLFPKHAPPQRVPRSPQRTSGT